MRKKRKMTIDQHTAVMEKIKQEKDKFHIFCEKNPIIQHVPDKKTEEQTMLRSWDVFALSGGSHQMMIEIKIRTFDLNTYATSIIDEYKYTQLIKHLEIFRKKIPGIKCYVLNFYKDGKASLVDIETPHLSSNKYCPNTTAFNSGSRMKTVIEFPICGSEIFNY